MMPSVLVSTPLSRSWAHVSSSVTWVAPMEPSWGASEWISASWRIITSFGWASRCFTHRLVHAALRSAGGRLRSQLLCPGRSLRRASRRFRPRYPLLRHADGEGVRGARHSALSFGILGGPYPLTLRAL